MAGCLLKEKMVQNIVEQAMKGNNTLAVVPRGFTRTFISSVLIKRKYADCQTLLKDNNKVVCLIEDYSSIVHWHYILKKNISVSLDMIGGNSPRKQISQHNVSIITPYLFLSLLNSGDLTWQDVCLLIIDQCHNAVTDQSLITLSNNYKQLRQKPLTIGFTSSIVTSKSTLESLLSDIEKLKDTFSFSIETLRSTENLSMCTNNLSEFIPYSTQTEAEENWTDMITNHFKNIHVLDLISNSDDDKPYDIVFRKKIYSDSWDDLMKDIEDFVIDVYNTLGLYAADKAVLLVICLMRKNMFLVSDDLLTTVMNSIITNVIILRKKMLCALKKCSSDEQYPLNQCSPKLKAFLLEVQHFKPNESHLVFVHYPETAMVLYYVIQDIQKTNGAFEHTKPEYILNIDFHSSNSIEMEQNDFHNAGALESFRLHECNVLFTLYEIEEIHNIPLCDLVILLDEPTSFSSYYQAKEKKMQSKKNLIVFYEKQNNFLEEYKNYEKLETSLLNMLRPTSDNDDKHNAMTSSSSIMTPITPASVQSLACKPQLEGEAIVADKDCEEFNIMEEIYKHLLPQDSNLQINEPGIIAGKKCNSRNYKKIIPEWLVESKLDAGKPFYIHVVNITPDVDFHSSIDQVYFELLNSKQTLSFTSSKKWPNLSSFYLYLPDGKYKIQIITNFKILKFTKEEMDVISNFQKFVFQEVVSLVKPFMIRNNESNSIFVIPTILKYNEGTALSVDWEAIRGSASFPEKFKNCKETINELKSAPINFHGKVVIPHHNKQSNERSQNDWCLIVSINEDMTPNSDMKCKYGSYADYFNKHYDAFIEIKDQPLIEVLTLPTYQHISLNRIQSRNKRIKSPFYSMTLVPELCTFINFPAAYIIKMSFLPCILHRTYQIMVCEMLRLKILNSVGLGKEECSIDFHPIQPVGVNHDLNSFSRGEITNLLVNSMQTLLRRNPYWKRCNEPRDIFRDLLHIDFIDMVHYQHFVDVSEQKLLELSERIDFSPKIIKAEVKKPPSKNLSLLAENDFTNSPNLWDILKAITCQSANDFGCSDRISGVDNFDLLDCNIPPYSVDGLLNSLYQDNIIPIKLITDLELDEREQNSGIYSAKTMDKIVNTMKEYTNGVTEKAYFPSLFGINYICDDAVTNSAAALIATYLMSCGIPGAIKLCNWLGIIIPESILSPSTYDIDCNGLIEPDKVEKSLDYTFLNKSYLHEAFMHHSCTKDRKNSTDNQSLIFLGEAIIDFLLNAFIHEHCKELSDDDAIALQHALNNDSVFACVSVRYSFYKNLYYTSLKLGSSINDFVIFQKNRDLGPEILLLINESDVGIEEDFDVPKVLSDLLKSLIAAVFLDTEQNFSITWAILHSLMHEEIDYFSKNIPIDLMTILKNRLHGPAAFSKATNIIIYGIPRTVIHLQVKLLDKTLVFSGYGEDKERAKRAAAKMALRHCGTMFMLKR